MGFVLTCSRHARSWRGVWSLLAAVSTAPLACGGDASGPDNDPDPTPAVVDAAASTLTASATTVAGTGSGTVQLIVQPRAADGAALQRSGLAVAFVREGTTPGTLSAVQYDASTGTYRATLTAPERMEPLAAIEGAFTATIGGVPVRGGSATPARAVLTFNTIPNPVIVATLTTAAQIGATPITGAAGERIFHVAAAAGDSWRLRIAPNGTSFTLEALHSSAGLSSTTGTVTQTTTTDGVRTTLTSATGSGATLALEVDNRTSSVSGEVRWNAVNTSVSGTGYKVSALAALAGEYVYAEFTTRVGGSSRSGLGTLRITSAGSMTLCEDGLLNETTLTCQHFRTNAVTPALTNFVASTTPEGLIRLTREGSTFAYLMAQPGDRGPALTFDRLGPDPLAPSAERRGIAFASPRVALNGTEGNGRWDCSAQGARITRFENTGTVARGTSLQFGGSSWTDELMYNRVATGRSTQAVLNGTINLFSDANPPTSVHILPLSSSLFIGGGEDELPAGVVAICPRT